MFPQVLGHTESMRVTLTKGSRLKISKIAVFLEIRIPYDHLAIENDTRGRELQNYCPSQRNDNLLSNPLVECFLDIWSQSTLSNIRSIKVGVVLALPEPSFSLGNSA